MTLASFVAIVSVFAGIVGVVVLLGVWPRLYRGMLTALAFTTCYITKPFYQEVFFEDYRGVDRGFGVTLPDYLFLGFFVYLLIMHRKRPIVWWPYNTTLWVLVILIAVASLFTSLNPYYGLFTIHKFIRCLILYWVVVNLVRTRADVHAVLAGLYAAVIFQTGVVLYEKYITREVVARSDGSFPHSNSLAMYINMILPVLLAMFISNVLNRRQRWGAVLAVFLGIGSVLLTKSRAAMVLTAGALSMTTLLTVVPRPTPRRLQLVFIGCILMGILGAIAAPKIIKRFQEAPKESEQTREYFNTAARAMADDRFLGVGINAYSWALTYTEYYWYMYPDIYEDKSIDRSEFRHGERGESRLGTAHHIYLLMAAETGWLGMYLFIAFLLRFYWKNIRLFFSTRDPYYKSLYLGLLVGFLTLHLHGLLEWVFRQTQVMYLFFLLSGLMVATERFRHAALLAQASASPEAPQPAAPPAGDAAPFPAHGEQT
jgi:hypothetical protein